ncbi:TPA: pilin [Burkholderia vietnamiensis]|nr:pilin [Burkholderia vietnamiensis]HDR9183349.1 pilin [Burkholderia vietnamiensis]
MLAFRVAEFYPVDVNKLSQSLEEDKPLALSEKSAITTKLKLGFTLIEVMIAVGIVGLVSAFAVPAYQGYTARSQVSEGITLAEGAKPFVSEYHANEGAFPASLLSGMKVSGKWVVDTALSENGQIVATFGSNVVKGLVGKKVMLTPSVQASGNLSWDCSSDAPKDYLPNSCQSVGSGAGGSDNNAGSGGNTQPSLDTWSSDMKKFNSNMFNFQFTNRYSDIGAVTYINDGSQLAYGTQRLKLANGAVYSVDFLAKDGTIVFKLDSGPDNYSFLAIGANQSQIGYGNIAYVKKGSNTINVSSNQNSLGVQTTPAKTVDATKTPWLNDYMNSTQFAAKNK